MAKERRVGNEEIVTKITVAITKVEGINDRLDKINGVVDDFKSTCPVYRSKVDNMEKLMETFLPQFTNFRIKLYGGIAAISMASILIGAGILKLILFLVGG